MEKDKLQLIQKIEAILFYLAEPTTVSFFVKTLEVSKKEVEDAIIELGKALSQRGLRLVRQNDEITLATAPELSGVIEKIIKEERERDLGRAGMETLAIVAYKGPVSKKDIEYIRGVNSQYAIRTLLVRGLIEKKSSLGDERVVVYSITVDSLRHLGLTHISELPEYESAQKQLEVVENSEEDNG